jgi:sugar phosphate permease
VFGLGIGLAFASMANLIVQSVPAAQTGAATGMNANIRTIGGSVGSAVMAGVVTARLGPTALPLESGYEIGFALLAMGMVLATMAAGLTPNTRHQPTDDAPDGARCAA